jgi:alpha-galactosidase
MSSAQESASRILPGAQHFFEQWFQAAIEPGQRNRLPLSFDYAGQSSAAILQEWQAEWSTTEHSTRAQTDASTRYTLTLTDPKTALQCRCEVTVFQDFPAIEWVVYFKNNGPGDTPIIANIQPLDVSFALNYKQACQLHYAKGSPNAVDDFAPREMALEIGSQLRLTCQSGRSSSEHLPFFNLATGEEGIIGAIGWTGGWSGTFSREVGVARLQAGMRETHLKLHPGEEIRTPRILLLFWQGQRIQGHNLLRRFILAHHTPRRNGKPLEQLPISDNVWGDRSLQDHLDKIQWIQDSNLPIEALWMDAGWHGNTPGLPVLGKFRMDWVKQVGNWFPKSALYLDGMKPLGDALQAAGMGFILWLEPERVYAGTTWAREHPEWLLGPGPRNHYAQDSLAETYLFNLGIPEARRFLSDFLSTFIEENGVTCYRQDFNMEPAPYWRAADAADRVGMSEIRYIEGLYALWDDLLERHPALLIDNCASGGRRIDLETSSRSVPLWRSDFQVTRGDNNLATQNHTFGLSYWIPLHGTHCNEPDTYVFRSALGSAMSLPWSTLETEMQAGFSLSQARKLLHEAQATRHYFSGDFYPHTPYLSGNEGWAVWQFDRPDLGEGMLLALRRPQDSLTRFSVQLQGLNVDSDYELNSLDDGSASHHAGIDLMNTGLDITINEQPGSALYVYKRNRPNCSNG